MRVRKHVRIRTVLIALIAQIVETGIVARFIPHPGFVDGVWGSGDDIGRYRECGARSSILKDIEEGNCAFNIGAAEFPKFP
jgi:hypothetical protein